jgi:hypothetical protein
MENKLVRLSGKESSNAGSTPHLNRVPEPFKSDNTVCKSKLFMGERRPPLESGNKKK